MPALARIRFLGDDLDPAVVTAALGLSPTRSHRRGDPMPRYPWRTRPRGSWSLESGLPEAATVEEHVARLLDLLGDRGTAIRRVIGPGVDGEVYVSCFVPTGTGTVLLSPGTLARVGALGLTLLVAVYCEDATDGNVPGPAAPVGGGETDP